MADFAPLDRGQPVLDEKRELTQRTHIWSQSVNRLAILEGSGPPEGVIEARTTRLYMDTSGTAGNILYIKQINEDLSGNRKNGWILV